MSDSTTTSYKITSATLIIPTIAAYICIIITAYLALLPPYLTFFCIIFTVIRPQSASSLSDYPPSSPSSIEPIFRPDIEIKTGTFRRRPVPTTGGATTTGTRNRRTRTTAGNRSRRVRRPYLPQLSRLEVACLIQILANLFLFLLLLIGQTTRTPHCPQTRN